MRAFHPEISSFFLFFNLLVLNFIHFCALIQSIILNCRALLTSLEVGMILFVSFFVFIKLLITHFLICNVMIKFLQLMRPSVKLCRSSSHGWSVETAASAMPTLSTRWSSQLIRMCVDCWVKRDSTRRSCNVHVSWWKDACRVFSFSVSNISLNVCSMVYFDKSIPFTNM